MPIVYVIGVAANITIRRADLCATDTDAVRNFSNSYVMIEDSDGLGWAQVGFERTFGWPVRHIGQFWNGNTQDPVNGGPLYLSTKYSKGSPLVGEIYSYSVRYASVCRCFRTMINTTVWQESDFNPYTSFTQPWTFSLTGEARYKESDVPGYSGLSPGPTRYENAQIYDEEFTWRALPCGTAKINDNPARWHVDSTACNYLRTYTIGSP